MAHKIKVSQEYVESLCEWLNEWSLKEDSFTVPQFLAKYGIAWKYLNQIMNKHPEVESSFQIVAARLHARWLQMAFETEHLSRHLSAIMIRYMRVYDSHAFHFDCEAKKQINDTSPVTLNVYETEKYDQIPLIGEFKKIYQQNADKRRSSSEAE